MDPDNLPEADDILAVCAGFVVTDAKSDIVRLFHYTTQKYFERTLQTWAPGCEEGILRTCFTYLSFESVLRSCFARDIYGRGPRKDHVVFEYAGDY